MTTQEWIAKNYQTEGYKTFGSVMKDNQGNVYSYGRHYPLLFRVNGIDFVNTQGYSVTTAKHINWAHAAINYNAVSVELDRNDIDCLRLDQGNMTDQERIGVIYAALADQVDRITKEMDSKKRKDTQVYALLADKLQRVQSSLERIA